MGNELMTEIGSRCRPEFKQDLSYRIKSRIENKIRKIFDESKKINQIECEFPCSSNLNWIILDSEEDKHFINYGDFKEKCQIVPLRKILKMLIQVKDGQYHTLFVKKTLQNKKKYKKNTK